MPKDKIDLPVQPERKPRRGLGQLPLLISWVAIKTFKTYGLCGGMNMWLTPKKLESI